MKAPISDIYIAPDRARQDLGDLVELQRSIQTVGLLHPVVVTPDHETIYAWRLIAGQRRIAACLALGLNEVPITVVNDLSELGEILAERDENTCRKELAPTEMVALAAEIERLERPKAAARRQDVRDSHASNGQFAPSGARARDGETRAIVANAVGTSARTLQRARAVVEAAQDDSDPVRAARAEEAVVEMDETGNIKGAWNKVFAPEGPLKCSVCQQEKDPDEFAGGGPEHRGGKTYECKACASARHAATTTPRRRAAADQNGSSPTRSRNRPKTEDPRVIRKRERMVDVERLWKQGFRYREIAEQLNSTERTIQDDVRNLGLAGQRRNGSHSQSVVETIDRVTTTLADVVGVIVDHKRRLRLDVEGIEISDEMAKEWESRLSMVGSASRLIRDIAKQKRNATDD